MKASVSLDGHPQDFVKVGSVSPMGVIYQPGTGCCADFGMIAPYLGAHICAKWDTKRPIGCGDWFGSCWQCRSYRGIRMAGMLLCLRDAIVVAPRMPASQDLFSPSAIMGVKVVANNDRCDRRQPITRRYSTNPMRQAACRIWVACRSRWLTACDMNKWQWFLRSKAYLGKVG